MKDPIRPTTETGKERPTEPLDDQAGPVEIPADVEEHNLTVHISA